MVAIVLCVADREEAPGEPRVGARRADRLLDAGEADQELVANKSGATRLGFALLLKFFELEARFPREVSELPPAVVSYMAEQVRSTLANSAGMHGRGGLSITAHRSDRRTGSGKRRAATRTT